MYRLSILALTLILPSGCVLNRQRRFAVHEPQRGQPQVVKQSDYTMTFIEFDDQGKMWSQNQLDETIHQIREAKQRNETNMKKLGLAHPLRQAIVLVYVHGWKNTSSTKGLSKSSDPLKFEQSLRETIEIQKPLAEKEGWPVVPVVGVYIAWRGKVATFEPLKTLSFFDRAWAARRISGPPLTEALVRIMKEAKGDPYSRCVVLGHSFGAVLLERAILQPLVARIIWDSEGSKFEMPADLIVLANSANDSPEVDQMIEFLRRRRVQPVVDASGPATGVLPIVLAVTAGGDNATRFLLPFGHSPYFLYQFLMASYRRPPGQSVDGTRPKTPCQGALNLHSAGHSPLLHSHGAREISCPGGAASIPAPKNGFVYDLDKPRACVEIAPLPDPPNGRIYNRTPFWVVRVPTSVSRNHGDIWGPNFRRMLYALLRESRFFDMRRTSPRVFSLQ